MEDSSRSTFGLEPGEGGGVDAGPQPLLKRHLEVPEKSPRPATRAWGSGRRAKAGYGEARIRKSSCLAQFAESSPASCNIDRSTPST
jgi:hypothetical protein